MGGLRRRFGDLVKLIGKRVMLSSERREKIENSRVNECISASKGPSDVFLRLDSLLETYLKN